ncbi:FAD-binding protein [Rhodococcus sp. (in: high G+C Gram-positive bacteria)]|uniref:FAD-binding protein n=1 Tax=Rhodococcus sp. TaxID=1831 RepID=UPI0019DEE955|nr:FAD-binding protein [Rhodococcus sp. (in: high G+C Gram-positive bacteria)]MBF0662041.1 FAD-binding protein [Rhodococcus sp. (in: high G+C Gram-positive bacteria)]
MVDWAEECDVLVVGSGAGGCSGAYTAAREGLSVTLVEASEYFGGTTAYSGGGGVWFPTNAVLQRAGDDDTIEDALTYFHAVVGDHAPRELQEAYVRGGAPLIDYLESDDDLEFMIYPWPDYFGKAPKARAQGRHIIPAPLPIGDDPELNESIRGPLGRERNGDPLPDTLIGGRALVGRFLRALRKYPDVELHLNTALEEIVIEDGVVVGAIVSNGGERRAIRARKGVVLAAGGFDRNEEMRSKYGVPGAARDSMGPWSNLGKAHEAGIAVGADVDLMGEAWWSPGLTHPDGRSAFALCFTGGIFVDQDGKRFTNEYAPYDRLGRDVIARMEAGEMTLPFWMIYDDRGGIVPPVGATNVPLVETEKYVEAGLWKSADTLAGLAEKIGVPVEALEATVARFNEFAARGVDEDFDRGGEPYDLAFTGGGSALVPIEQGPFHAAQFGLSDLGTKGGLRTDTVGRVLDTSGAPIAGLYAAGNTMAAASGTVYPGGGNPIGASALFAHLAVLDAATR